LLPVEIPAVAFSGGPARSQLILLTVHLGHLTAVRNEGWGHLRSEVFRSTISAANLPANGWFYLGDGRFSGFLFDSSPPARVAERPACAGPS